MQRARLSAERSGQALTRPPEWAQMSPEDKEVAEVTAEELNRLDEEHRADLIREFVREWLDYSERRMAHAISALPAGRLTASGRHDTLPGLPDGVPVKVSVEVKPAEGVVEVDLRDNIDCVPVGVNLSQTCATAGDSQQSEAAARAAPRTPVRLVAVAGMSLSRAGRCFRAGNRRTGIPFQIPRRGTCCAANGSATCGLRRHRRTGAKTIADRDSHAWGWDRGPADSRIAGNRAHHAEPASTATGFPHRQGTR